MVLAALHVKTDRREARYGRGAEAQEELRVYEELFLETQRVAGLRDDATGESAALWRRTNVQRRYLLASVWRYVCTRA